MWHRVLSLEDLAVGACARVTVAGRAVALARRTDGVFALDDRCPHAEGPLGEGTLEDGEVACPWHGWRFDPRTGACRENPHLTQRVFAVRVSEGAIEIEIAEEA